MAPSTRFLASGLNPERYLHGLGSSAHPRHNATTNWLICPDAHRFNFWVDRYLEQLASRSPVILLAESDPVRFLAGFMVACTHKCPVFLGNPNWAEGEWRQVFAQVQPDVVWGSERVREMGKEREGKEMEDFLSSYSCSSPILIPTGGSSGRVRFAVHTWQTLMASVQGFQEYFQVDQVHSFCVLPLYHVSGLMQFLRSLVSGGTLVIQPYKHLVSDLASGNGVEGHSTDSFISLVPTQLQRLLDVGPAGIQWLSQFRTILLGGGPAWPALLEQARQHRLNLAPTYGMTETASQIATLKPQDFLAGNDSCGQILPHAQVSIYGGNNALLNSGQLGQLAIRSKSLALGYYPDTPLNRFTDCSTSSQDNQNETCCQPDFWPDDLGFLDEQGYLYLAGRNSSKIISGGENIFPAEVEAAIQATGLVRDVCVVGVTDRHWGQAVAAVYVPLNSSTSTPVIAQELKAQIAPHISRYKQPKHWIAINQLPRNAQGKMNRDRLLALIKPHLPDHC